MGRSPFRPKEGLNRGAWTSVEDKILTDYIKAHGEGRWRTIPKKAGLKRCGKSCRLRWLNYLRPDIKRGNISPDEEDLIIRLHKLLGNRWSLIAGRLPGRTDNEIKNYWNTKIAKKVQDSTQTATTGRWFPNKPSTPQNVVNGITDSKVMPPRAARPQPFKMSPQVVRTKATKGTKVVIDVDPLHQTQQYPDDSSPGVEGAVPVYNKPNVVGGESCWKDLMVDFDVGDISLSELLGTEEFSDFCGFKCSIDENSNKLSPSTSNYQNQNAYFSDEMLQDWATEDDSAQLQSFLDSNLINTN